MAGFERHIETSCNITNATYKWVGGGGKGEGGVGSQCQLTQVMKLCAQWSRQMATALIIP